MKHYYETKLSAETTLLRLIEALACEMEKEMHRQREARRSRIKRGATLRPSADTPLWNAVVALVVPRLRRRGARALLARELGLHRARIGEFFGRSAAMPDAERTLRLLVWLGRQSAPKAETGAAG